MTIKQKILSVIESLDENVSIDEAIYRLYLLQKVEIGRQQIAEGQFVEHDEFMKQLEEVE